MILFFIYQKLKAAEDAADGKVPRRLRRTSKDNMDDLEADTGDDYDMICVRGGSPPQQDALHARLEHHDKQRYYRSDDSYDSAAYDSYDDRKRQVGSFLNKESRKNDVAVSRKRKRLGSNRRTDEKGDDSTVFYSMHFIF